MNLKNKTLLKNKYLIVFAWLLLTALFIFLTLNRHSRTGVFNYHSEIWADKAGYYVYLPSTFIYHFDASSFPDSITKNTGNGFILDTSHHVVKTKYPYGVALLQTPFFLAAHWLAKPLGYADNGFTLPYYRAIDFAAVFYFIIGLVFLWAYLRKSSSRKLSFFTLLFSVSASNLYYYAIDETGMSHIYSFALFSFLIWLFTIFDIKKTFHVFLIAFLFALVIVVRPVNIIFLLFLVLIEKDKWRLWFSELRKINIIKTFALVSPAVIVLLIQLLYWGYASGNYFSNPYKGESFIYYLNPQLVKVWFSTNNGLFTYSPIWFFIIIAIVSLVFHDRFKGWMYLSLFLVLSYTVASWWSWWMGCGFGHRAYVEYLPVFLMPVLFLWKKMSTNRFLLVITLILFAIFSIYNLMLTYCWDGCFYGETWDWSALSNKFLEAF
ncbi:MAG: hypothetical protein WCQ95_02685 [Bacteroidota bacterium]